ncbi:MULTISPECIES: prolyl aminopeptidase [Rhizobium]|jgi:proline iminopeptidase|uniref:prolyl aminopeptidase n=1 Tax=Rhizobium TaxID=379 RepID=UPI000BE8C615|nr:MULTISPECIES: prolyl aminopeptidase [Rhizobium]MBB3522657.1 proline iminopeptidase [Rhizobium sp. BK456]MBY4588788.1 prolyl aminopeptidase [Rhizobium redzepovicii]MBY4617086.1 prolyl aminopeptidase [Rhizobium redzepovicii]MDF0658430.1 prolyl aminopeptidase [Rhizobium sp. BC49]PDS82296.1 prolyl aminopeptidase [Rhizobium sp. L18]
MSALYPEIEPYDHGLLDTGDGNLIYWEACGNPAGRPALVLHGGPGSGCSTTARRHFDPDAYRIILFDQRNCGRSLPSAADRKTDLSLNTTWHLVGDIERLRLFFGIDAWLVFGNSWGSTLSLAYAETHPQRVVAIVISGVTTTRRSEIDWLCRGMAPLFPEEWHRFRQAASADSQERDEDIVAAYHRLLNHSDSETRLKAARDWHDWEAASILLADPQGLPRRWADPAYLLTRARIITHYFVNGAWLEDGQLLNNAGRLTGIPAILLQGRLDIEAPLVTAWELARAWPQSELQLLPHAAHSIANPDMSAAIVAATDRFRDFQQK